MTYLKYLTSMLIISTFLSAGLFAAPQIPAYSSPLLDQAGLLNSSQKKSLIKTIQKYRASGGPDMAVYIIPSLEGANLEDYSLQVARKWRLGSSTANDGVLFFIALGDRKMRIEVGTGISHKLSNRESRKILSQNVGPLFKQKKYAAGIKAALTKINSEVQSQTASLPNAGYEHINIKTAGSSGFGAFAFLLFMIAIVFIIGSSIKGSKKSGTNKGVDHNIFIHGNNLTDSSSSSNYTDSSSYTDTSSYSGGGDSFGGDGGSGSW